MGIHERAVRAAASKFGSAPLYRACKAALDNKDIKLMSSQKRLLTKYVLEGVLNGHALPPEEFDNFVEDLKSIVSKTKEYKMKYEV
jgi:oligopeptidase A